MKIGVLALQGDVPEHRAAIARLVDPASIVEVRSSDQLVGLDGLLLPGGESTTLSKLLRETRLFHPLRERIEQGLSVLATCAGLILLAKELAPSEGGEDPETLQILDVVVRRNDYGRQAESFEAPLRIPELGEESFPGVFIRAPRIVEVREGATPIAFLGDQVVGVRSGNLWGLTFHPELAHDTRLHAGWLAAIRAGADQRATRAK
jgi:pyridoxal 5'-phosphate synthase pdxT subunit